MNFTVLHVPTSRNVLFQKKQKAPAACCLHLKKAWGGEGTGDKGKYNTISTISPPTPPHAGGGGHGVGWALNSHTQAQLRVITLCRAMARHHVMTSGVFIATSRDLT